MSSFKIKSNNYKLGILTLWLVFIAQSFWGQSNVNGKVNDANGAIPGVKVNLNNGQHVTITNLEGNFNFKNIKPGTYALVLSFIGMDTINTSITVKEGNNNLETFVLKEAVKVAELKDVYVRAKQNNSDSKANNIQKNDNVIGNVEYVGDGKQVAYNAADNLQKMPAVTVQKDQGEGRYVSVRGTPTNWNSTMINGDRLPVADEESETRTMAFDVLSSDLIAYIKVMKALTPDVEADAIGGSVNFISKTSPDSTELKFNLMAGYNAQANKPIYNGNVFFGTRSKNNKWGFLFNSSVYVRNWGTDNFEVVYGSNYNHGLNRLELRDYNGLRSTYSGNIALDYEFKPGMKIYFKSLVGYFTDDERNMKTRYNYAIGAGSTIMLQHIHSKTESLLYGGELGTELKLTKNIKLDFKLAHYSNQFKYGPVPFKRGDKRNGYFVMNFEKFNVKFLDQIYLDKNGNSYKMDLNGNPIDAQGNIVTDPNLELSRVKLIGQDNPQGNGDAWDNIQPKIYGQNRIEDYEFSGAYSELNNTWEKDPIIASASIEHTLKENLKIKYGGKFRAKKGYRSLSLFNWYQDFNTYAGALKLKNYKLSELKLNGGFLNELGNPYDNSFMPFMAEQSMDNFINAMGDTLREEPMSVAHHDFYEFVGSTYSYQENAEAAFLMFDYQWSKKWTLIAGVRVEATQLKMTGDTVLDGENDWFLAHVYNVPDKGYEVVPVANDPYANSGYERVVEYTVGYPVKKVNLNMNYIIPLPMVHLRYDMNKQTVLRAAITRTYRRPNFIETKPGAPIINYTNLEYNIGNPNLKPSFAWNLDLSYEYYIKNAGLATLGLFGKLVQDHIYRTITADADPQQGIVYKSYQNAKKPIFVLGVELNFKKKMDFFKNGLKDLGVDVNTSYIYSRMKLPGRSFAQSLPMQPSVLFNAALFYENDKTGLFARIAVNYTGKYLMELNTSAVIDANNQPKLLHDDTDFDVFMKDRWGMDFNVGWKINRHFQVYAELANLLNTPLYIYRGKEYRPMQVEYYSFKANIGLKLNF